MAAGTTYIAVLRKESDSDYGVSFPDFPGCVTGGSSLSEAMSMAEEALELHIFGLLEEGEVIPASSITEEIVENPEHADGLPFLVTVRNLRTHAVRVNITLPAAVLEEIDKAAEYENTTRSGFLAEAALDRIRDGN